VRAHVRRALDLAIFYVLLPGTGFGEAWLPSSWLQFAGLVVSDPSFLLLHLLLVRYFSLAQ
jgi:hypothetical protein